MAELRKDYFALQVTILRLAGVEVHENESIPYKIYSVIFLFIVIYSYTAVACYEVYYFWKDIDVIFSMLSYVITYVIGIVKVAVLYYNRKKLGQFLKTLQTGHCRPNLERGGEVEFKIMARTITLCDAQTATYIFLVLGILFPGIYNAIYPKTSTSGPQMYPYMPFSLFDARQSPLYELVFAYQYTCFSFFAAIIINNDSIICSVMAHLSAQLRILQNAFRRLKVRSEEMSVKQGEDSFMRCVGESVLHHEEIIKIVQEVETVFNLLSLSMMGCNILLICFSMYQSSLQPIGSALFLQNLSYCVVIVFQVLMYCWWGNEVTLESARVALAAAQVDWVGTEPRVQRALVFIMARAQKPLELTAGKFAPLSLQTFMSIVRGAVSYFMVLKRMQS